LPTSAEPATPLESSSKPVATLGELDGLVLNYGIVHVGRLDEITPSPGQ
jgi:hypothetical protein